MDRLTLFGLFAVTAMLLCYALEDRSRWFVLGFAVACALGSIYGFLQGAWPFGLVEAIWASSRCGGGASGGNDLTGFGQARRKTFQRTVKMGAAALDEERVHPRLRRAQRVNA